MTIQKQSLWRNQLASSAVNQKVCGSSPPRDKRACWTLATPQLLGFPCGSAGKEFSCNAGDLGLIPGLGRSPGEGKDYPLQYSDLENSMDCIIHEVSKSRTRLSNFTFTLSLSFKSR